MIKKMKTTFRKTLGKKNREKEEQYLEGSSDFVEALGFKSYTTKRTQRNWENNSEIQKKKNVERVTIANVTSLKIIMIVVSISIV